MTEPKLQIIAVSDLTETPHIAPTIQTSGVYFLDLAERERTGSPTPWAMETFFAKHIAKPKRRPLPEIFDLNDWL
jgi:hypothetical protein